MKKIQINETQLCSETLANLQGESAAHVGMVEQAISDLKTVNASLEVEEKKIEGLIASLTATLTASVNQREANRKLITDLSIALNSVKETPAE